MPSRWSERSIPITLSTEPGSLWRSPLSQQGRLLPEPNRQFVLIEIHLVRIIFLDRVKRTELRADATVVMRMNAENAGTFIRYEPSVQFLISFRQPKFGIVISGFQNENHRSACDGHPIWMLMIHGQHPRGERNPD